jgi:hypothetical protein
VADLTVVHIRRNFIDRMKQKKGGSTIRGTVAALSGALRFAVRNGTITRSPIRDLQRGDLPSAGSRDPLLRRPARLRGARAHMGEHRLRQRDDLGAGHQDRGEP